MALSEKSRVPDWTPLLERWDQLLLADEEVEIDGDSARLPGATEQEITRLERALRVELPSSYRSFLRISNGWQAVGPESIGPRPPVPTPGSSRQLPAPLHTASLAVVATWVVRAASGCGMGEAARFVNTEPDRPWLVALRLCADPLPLGVRTLMSVDARTELLCEALRRRLGEWSVGEPFSGAAQWREAASE
ncbi:MAG: SMI1/KNR4 family protein [Planctomycetota bacterium]